ncbi:hypothetical protein Tco_1228772 [Tanacetum coccineum]
MIMGMDWLSKRKFMIVCHEKVVRVPLEGDEILRVHGERTLGAAKALMNAKLDKTKLSDISDLVPGVTPIAKSPYRLAPSEMQELSEQYQGLQDKVLGSVRFAKILGTKGMGWLNAFQFLVGSVMDEAHASSLTKLTQFQAIQEDCKNVKFARIYIDEIVARNEILVMLKLQISVDKTLRLVEEPIEIGDYKGKSKILLEVLVKDGYEGFLVDGCFFSFGAVMLLCVPLCGQSKLLAVRYLVKVSWSSKYNFELAWLWEDYVIDNRVGLDRGHVPALFDVIKWSHDLGRGHACPSWIVVDRGVFFYHSNQFETNDARRSG